MRFVPFVSSSTSDWGVMSEAYAIAYVCEHDRHPWDRDKWAGGVLTLRVRREDDDVREVRDAVSQHQRRDVLWCSEGELVSIFLQAIEEDGVIGLVKGRVQDYKYRVACAGLCECAGREREQREERPPPE